MVRDNAACTPPPDLHTTLKGPEMTPLTPATVKRMESVSLDPNVLTPVVDAIHALARQYIAIDRLAWEVLNTLEQGAGPAGLPSATRDAVQAALQAIQEEGHAP